MVTAPNGPTRNDCGVMPGFANDFAIKNRAGHQVFKRKIRSLQPMPLHDLDLDSDGIVAADPKPLDLHDVIMRSIDTRGVNETAEHYAEGIDQGYPPAVVVEVINDCITEAI